MINTNGLFRGRLRAFRAADWPALQTFLCPSQALVDYMTKSHGFDRVLNA